jgi:hypothetical protein
MSSKIISRILSSALIIGIIGVGKVIIKKIGLSSAGKIAATKGLGKIAIGGTAMGGAREVVYSEASTLLKNTALKTITEKELQNLSLKYPRLNINKSNVNSLVEVNKQLEDDLILMIYQKDPTIFNRNIKDTLFLKEYPRALDDLINKKIAEQTSREAETLIGNSLRRLEQDGIDIKSLSSLEKAKVEKIIANTIKQEILSIKKVSEYQWGYKNGKLFISQTKGNRIIEQEISITAIVAIAIGGKIIIDKWDKQKIQKNIDLTKLIDYTKDNKTLEDE